MVAEIAVVGSLNLDLVVPVERVPLVGETVLGGDLVRNCGGKGGNQATAAARLGRRVAMVARVGDDDAAEILRRGLDTDEIDVSRVVGTPGVPSGVALIAVEAAGDNAIVVAPGANARLRPEDVRVDAVATASVVLVQLEIPIETVEAAVAHATGTVVCNPAPAPPGGLPASLLGALDVLVPNETELYTLAGAPAPDGDAPGIEALDEMARGLGAHHVVVTLGARGALVVTPDVTELVPAPTVRPVDTTAAGDSFCGGLADRLAAGEDLLTATRWAVRVGAATTLRAGAQPSLPTPEEVERLLAP
ncbi:MAG: ribokinase [Actinomycetota bacterium]|nr:ribokinase [Actinomycetota bacterium]